MSHATVADPEEEIITEIVRTITDYLHPGRIILFGSRARGKGQRYSDFDIAVERAEMDHRTERRLKEALDDKLGIFIIDLINLDKVDPEFKALILQHSKVVYER